MICPYHNVLNVTIDNTARKVSIPEIALEPLLVWKGQLVARQIHFGSWNPQSVRQKIREARKPFPLCRGRGEAMIESGIHYKICPDWIRDGP
jgi:hypothetical protein